MLQEDYFQTRGIRVGIVTLDERIADTARLALDEKGFEPAPGPADITFDLTGSAESPGQTGELISGSDGVLRIRHDHPHYHIEHGNAGLTVCVETGRATAFRLPPSGALSSGGRLDLMMTIALSLYTLLRPHGYFGLHGVGLVAGGRGFVLSGASDSGKSTTALALVRQGWQYLSDDSLLLRLRGKEVEATGLRRHFCVDPSASDFFPELADHAWPPQVSDPEKWKVDVEVLYPGQSCEAARPSVLLFPQVEPVAESRLEAIRGRDAFDLLAKQSAFSPYGKDPLAADHFAVLTTLLRQCEAHRLILGRDVIDDPAAFSRLLTG